MPYKFFPSALLKTILEFPNELWQRWIFCVLSIQSQYFAGQAISEKHLQALSVQSAPIQPGHSLWSRVAGPTTHPKSFAVWRSDPDWTLWPNSWLHICALQWQWQLNRLYPPPLFEPHLVGVPPPHPLRKAAIKILYSSCGSSWKVF